MIFGNAFRPRRKTRLDFSLGGMERQQTSAFTHRFRRAVQGNECLDLKGLAASRQNAQTRDRTRWVSAAVGRQHTEGGRCEMRRKRVNLPHCRQT